MRRILVLTLIIVLAWPAMALASGTWRLVLASKVSIASDKVLLGDLAVQEIPARQAGLVMMGAGEPGSEVVLDRRTILRKLVQLGMASGVVFAGPPATTVEFTGETVKPDDLQKLIKREIQGLIPAPLPDSPDPFVDLKLPEADFVVGPDMKARILRTNPLEPGRNQIRVQLNSSRGSQEIPVLANLHYFGQVPSARGKISRGTSLTPDLFDWQWLDLAEIQTNTVTSPDQLLGQCVNRSLSGGDGLRRNDLQPVPTILAGDRVELKIRRGGLVVSVQALARQAGCLGQTIPVRNELNGKLVNARVAGPGLVEWR